MIIKINNTWFTVWVAAVFEEFLELLHWQQLWVWVFKFILSLGDDNEVTSDGDIIGGGVLEILCEMVELLEVVVDLILSLGLFTGLWSLSTVEDKFELVLLGVEWLLTDCRTGLTTFLKENQSYHSFKMFRIKEVNWYKTQEYLDSYKKLTFSSHSDCSVSLSPHLMRNYFVKMIMNLILFYQQG